MLYTSAGEWLSWFARKPHRVRGHQTAALKTSSLRVCTDDRSRSNIRTCPPDPMSTPYHPGHTQVQQFVATAALSSLNWREENIKDSLLISLSGDWMFLQSSKVCCSRNPKDWEIGLAQWKQLQQMGFQQGPVQNCVCIFTCTTSRTTVQILRCSHDPPLPMKNLSSSRAKRSSRTSLEILNRGRPEIRYALGLH